MTYLTRLCLALALALGLSGPIQAQDTEIEATIQSQFDAFLADDVETAFSYASPMIKGLFGTPQNFGMMVRQGYPMVWRPDGIRYLSLREENGRTIQRVQIRDGAGMLHWLDYDMVQSDAGWQINGVRFVQMPGVGA